MKVKSNKNGITLIALVITIIVLLILAGVSIQAILGENGIAEKASQAKENTAIATEIEQIDVSYADCQTENMTGSVDNAEVTSTQLETAMNNAYGAGTVEVTGTVSKLTVEYLESGREYTIKLNGKAQLKINYDELFETAQKHPDQTESNDIGIAEDGSIVNLDLWGYLLYDMGSYVEEGYVLSTSTSSYNNGGYRNEDIIDGKIQGQVPMYIKEEGSDTYYPVVSMFSTFYGCTNLEVAPEIPSTVSILEGTFYGCTNLRKAPTIDSQVQNIRIMFHGCRKLTGSLKIYAGNLYDYYDVLYNVATAEGCKLVLSGTSPDLQEIFNTKSDNSNITMK